MAIKVLHLISTKYGIGGAEKFLLDMSEEFNAERFSVSYCNIFSDENSVFPKEIRRRNLEFFEIKRTNWTNLPQLVWQLVSFMRREQFDIVHTHLLQGSIIGQIAAQMAGVPTRIITRQYTNENSSRHKYLYKLDAYVARRVTKVIAISSAVKTSLLEQGVHSDQIELIPLGITLKPFNQNSQTNQELSLKAVYPNNYLLAYTANLHDYKGHRFLLEAMAKLASKYTDIHLLLIGEGPERKNLEELVSQLKLKDKATFLGHQSNVPALLKEIDLYIHPTTIEALGIAVIEAMAAGKCVIASEVGGIPDIIEHERSGFLVAPREITELVKVVSRARENPKLIQEVAEAGRRHVEENFSIQAIAKQYQQLYETCVNSLSNKIVPKGE